MSTQGVVSVVQGGKVIFKIVAGCNGYNAPALANRLKRLGRMTLEGVTRAAHDADFGCEGCLVVMGEKFTHTNADELDALYRETFQQPTFNPRWHHGIAEYTCVVDLDECRPSRSRAKTTISHEDQTELAKKVRKP